nr:PQQ-binding-like beta-propeller repeat protein [Rhizobium sp. P38BS-XIX]
MDKITTENVQNLKKAWSFSTGDLPRPGENSKGHEFSFEATPIKVGDNLYFCTPHREVVALDATSGQLKWRYDPAGDMSHNVYQACRGSPTTTPRPRERRRPPKPAGHGSCPPRPTCRGCSSWTLRRAGPAKDSAITEWSICASIWVRFRQASISSRRRRSS